MIPDSALQIGVSLPCYRQGWFQAWAKLLAAKGRSLPGATSSPVSLAGNGGDGCSCSRHDPIIQPFPSKLCAIKRIEKKKHIQRGTHSAASTEMTCLPKDKVKIFGLQNEILPTLLISLEPALIKEVKRSPSSILTTKRGLLKGWFWSLLKKKVKEKDNKILLASSFWVKSDWRYNIF